jgi:hypothetical protein
MKLKTAITAAVLALGIVSQAGAQNVVYVTGSTAFRSIVFNALNTPGRVFDGTPTRATRGNSNPASCAYMLFLGNINGTPTYIDCAWSGSEAGIASAADVTIDNDGTPLPGSPETWMKADGSVSMTDSASAPTAGELEESSRGADLAFADTSQAVSLTPYVANTSTALKDYGTIGIVTFAWIKNRQTTPSAEWTALNNITLPQINQLISQGYQQTALFTGVATHTNNVYLVGRNKGSGTRANQLADSGYGTTRTVQQFSIGGGVTNSQTDTLLLEYVGNNGYEGGGGVARALRVDGSCQQNDPFFPANPSWFAVGFLGTGDALSTGNGYTFTTNNWLAADGVFPSDGTIEEGSYYFWGHEHLFGKYQISGFQDTTGNAIFAGVQAQIGTAGSDPAAHSGGIALEYMHCDKASDVAFPARF